MNARASRRWPLGIGAAVTCCALVVGFANGVGPSGDAAVEANAATVVAGSPETTPPKTMSAEPTSADIDDSPLFTTAEIAPSDDTAPPRRQADATGAGVATAGAVALPIPDPLPLDPYAPTAQVTIGQLEIPTIGLDQTLQQGMTLTAINRGPSHWPGTALPGEVGNTVIAGHRTTRGKPFRNLDQLVPGDLVYFTTETGRHTYEVTETEIVTPDALWISHQTQDKTATLFACHPPGSARERIVVRLAMLDEDPGAMNGDITPPLPVS